MAKQKLVKKGNRHIAEAREIERHLKEMRDNVDSLADSLKDMGTEELRILKSKIRNFVAGARAQSNDYMREVSHQAQEKMHDVHENVTQTIRHKPLASVAIAAGFGFVAALIAKGSMK